LPVYMDIEGASKKKYQIGMLRSANLGRGAQADARIPLRWHSLAERFFPFDEAKQRAYAESFAIPMETGLPAPPYQSLDERVSEWNVQVHQRKGAAPSHGCGGLQVKISVEELLSRGHAMFTKGHPHECAECLYKALEKVNNRDKRAAKRGKSASKESKRFRRNIMHTLMALKANTGGLIEAYMPLQIRLEEMNCLPPGGKMEIVSVANRAADLFDAGDRDWSRACFGLALLLPGAEEHKSQVRENFIALGGKLEALKPSRGGGSEGFICNTRAAGRGRKRRKRRKLG